MTLSGSDNPEFGSGSDAGSDFIVPLCREEPAVLYADNSLLLVNKPSGLLSVPGRHPLNRDCLISRLQGQWPTALIVHRLDMDTSGIMVIALNKEVQANLSRQFQLRQVDKQYEAVVFGLVATDSGSVDAPLITDWPQRPLQKICYEQGKPALTRYRVLQRDHQDKISKLLLEPQTGRSHQLRVHLRELGHPILGDSFYGCPTSKAMAPRLMLHAMRLAFTHPATGEVVIGESAANFMAEPERH
jgi:tRNA pseudouridine32 synthase/23S rRNA pseudouridine746 synthase